MIHWSTHNDRGGFLPETLEEEYALASCPAGLQWLRENALRDWPVESG